MSILDFRKIKTIKASKWLLINIGLILCMLAVLAYRVIVVDPFMHYHAPLTDEYYYELDNERSMNDGIARNFDYDAIIIGTSMTQNFKTTELDELFHVNSIKLPFSGASYKEINDNAVRATGHNPKVKLVLRCLDYLFLFTDKDDERTDMTGYSEYPTYLYDNNPFNDVEYVFNRDIIFERVYTMGKNRYKWFFHPGITSFNDYSNWMSGSTFGPSVFASENIIQYIQPVSNTHITEDEKEIVLGTIKQNVTSIAEEHPEIEFYYFYPPYSMQWWRILYERGEIPKYLEAEQLAIEEMLKYKNIKLFSFCNNMDITTNLNNYMDSTHYGEWVNTLILNWMKAGEYLLTEDNYRNYISQKLDNYTSFDYASIMEQEDYECDYFADAVVRAQYTGIAPVSITDIHSDCYELQNAVLDEAGRDDVLLDCIPTKDMVANFSESDSLENYNGCKWTIHNNNHHYKYLACNYKVDSEAHNAGIFIFNMDGELMKTTPVVGHQDHDFHQLLVDLDSCPEEMFIVINGGYKPDEETECGNSVFSDIIFY